MARKQTAEKKSVTLSDAEVRGAIPKIERRLNDLIALDVSKLDNFEGPHTLDGMTQKTNATIREIYGPDTVE